VIAAVPLDANLILGGYVIVAVAALVFGFFTARGSGINNHPCDGRECAPGSRLPDEFHQFADRQVHDADMRRAETERRVDERIALLPDEAWEPPRWHAPQLHLPHRHAADDISLDEANRRLAAEAAARRSAASEQEDHARTR
jgi:hypothetical protein